VTLVTAGKVSSTYWQHNPGSEERVPRIARLIPTMTPDAVAARVARALERESEEIVIPSVLKLLYLVHALLPRTVQGVTTRTGWPHPLRAATRAAGNEDDDGVPAALRP
jgi:short-subunit dehydrogenase